MTGRPRLALAIAATLAAAAGGCAPAAATPLASPAPMPAVAGQPPAVAAEPHAAAEPRSTPSGPCADCVRTQLTPDEAQRIESRIAELKRRGAPCATYAEVLERSFRDGRITIRPYMWRVGHQLVSGEAYPDGAIFLAREIDPLNVGRRSFDEVVWTMEHEAAHIALKLDAPFDRAPGDRADAVVRECRA